VAIITKTYIRLLVSKEHNLEVFIEGGRSRIGKLLAPKLGILKLVLENVLDEKIQDAIICPIAIGYDKVCEEDTHTFHSI